MAETVELWGTFAVADHLRPKPFVTDVLLYDRLVVPVPKAGHRDEEWRSVWNVRKLQPLLDLMGDLVIQMPWGAEERDDGLRRYGTARAVTRDMQAIRHVDPDAPAYQVTRAVLADYANRQADNDLFARLKALAKGPGTRVEAVAAYGSPEDLRTGLGMTGMSRADPQGGSINPAAVFDWTVHTPDGEDDSRLLKLALRLAARPDFQEHRRIFYNRLRDLPGLSNDEIRADLKKRLADYERIMRGQGWNTAAQRAIQVVEIGSPLLALLDQLSGALAGVAINAAAQYVSKHLDRPEPDERTRVAAMAYEIRAQFGDRLRLGGEGPSGPS